MRMIAALVLARPVDMWNEVLLELLKSIRHSSSLLCRPIGGDGGIRWYGYCEDVRDERILHDDDLQELRLSLWLQLWWPWRFSVLLRGLTVDGTRSEETKPPCPSCRELLDCNETKFER
ncbi:hypothetical protein ACMD2_21491 [Ananas comosus]|uniref:Uncharacterized protein n=1 Tax=Ananas comosus TaxID=4615 RepID=A0A199UYP2_ANACO|nr:hypothetical protein ACMD2_21491 [Ananas comosus]